MCETFRTYLRGSILRSTSNEVPVKDGNSAALCEALRVKGEGMEDIGGFNPQELRELFWICLTTGISKLAPRTYGAPDCLDERR